MSAGSVPKRMPRPHDVVFPRTERVEERRKELSQRKLLDEFFDHTTLLAVSRLANQGLFDAVDYPISTGKEGGVFRATLGREFRAVKIYRIGNATFRIPDYVLEQLRREASVRNWGGLIYAWTRREHTLLGRLEAAGVRVPHPYGHYRNVLVMEYIGTPEGAAPRLKDALVADPAALYKELVREIGAMVRKAHLVHGDLSPYNTLYLGEEVVLIDVAQAIPSDHPNAHELLVRDLTHFARFLSRLGHPVDPAEFLTAVGGDELKPAARAE
jgi:RIO kinase 1